MGNSLSNPCNYGSLLSRMWCVSNVHGVASSGLFGSRKLEYRDYGDPAHRDHGVFLSGCSVCKNRGCETAAVAGYTNMGNDCLAAFIYGAAESSLVLFFGTRRYVTGGKVMQYKEVYRGIFQKRPNRFIAEVELEGVREICHVKNTGRCRELLVPGAVVYLEKSQNPTRKTRYSLIAVEKGDLLINMDSQAPNHAAEEWLAHGGVGFPVKELRPEYTWGSSRFDFYCDDGETRHLIEVKGVTLEEQGVVRFPDAPTARGARHVRELCESMQQGYQAHLLFVVQMEQASIFLPNRATDPEFAKALEEAEKCGVDIRAVCCRVTPNSMEIDREIPVRIQG